MKATISSIIFVLSCLFTAYACSGNQEEVEEEISEDLEEEIEEELDEAEENIAAHHKAREPFDHVPGSICACVPLPDNQFGRRDIERQAQHQRRQKHRGKCRKI